MRLSSNSILRASFVAAWLASTVLAIPQVVDREDPPPSPPAPPKPIATADQVDIAQPNTTSPPPQESKPPIPITVQLFPSSPGVKTCRGSSFVNMELPKNASTEPVFTTKDGQCYNLPGTAQCGIFMGNKADGCEAKLFRGERCTAFSNVAVFQDELRPVGGFFTSMSIKCGIVPVEPKPLSLGGLGGKMQKPVQGKRSRAARAVDAAMQAG
ncbi:sulfate permease ii [Colletotrichum incanum]|uniref:Sulfate permease ii n=1 Tax=Colletotrichum incanum TaxID=1573173 RepID=A0A167CGF9_COLIC|nr:sulfate permease ii [Colletotrichum incanum]OHW89568.1 hypothetical protein CSPAE12_11790 [Colletotrichum incanum]